MAIPCGGVDEEHPPDTWSGDSEPSLTHPEDRPSVPQQSDGPQSTLNASFPSEAEDTERNASTDENESDELGDQIVEPAVESEQGYVPVHVSEPDPPLETAFNKTPINLGKETDNLVGRTLETDTTQASPGDPDANPNELERIADRTPRLADTAWSGHITEVCDGLAKAETAGLTPEQMHTVDGAGQIWTDERAALHMSILEDLYTQAAHVPCEFKAIIAGGLGGAGKTTVLTEHAGIELSQYLMINPDDFKEEMARRGMLPEIEGLSPMEVSDLAHEESSYLALQLASRAQAEGKNIIWDITMSSEKSVKRRIDDLHEAGYNQIDGIFVDIPIATSIRRTESRHREGYEKYLAGEGLGGRYIPPEVLQRQKDEEFGSKNKRAFNALGNEFTNWIIYDNSADGLPAKMIDSSRLRNFG